jgi:RNA polymerase primary sigma factor
MVWPKRGQYAPYIKIRHMREQNVHIHPPIADADFLDCAEERKLIRQYREIRKSPRNPDSVCAGRLAQERIVLTHQRLVFSLAARYRWGRDAVDFDDMVSAGNEGLLMALDRFRLRRGARFSTYARWWITNKILIYVRAERWPTHISDHMYRSVLAYEKALRKLKNILYRAPMREEITQEMGITLDQLNKIDQCRQQEVFSLDMPVGDGESSISDFLEDKWTPRPDDTVQDAVRQSAMRELMANLTPREEKVVRLRFGVGCPRAYTDREIAAECRVTVNRVRAIGREGLTKMRHCSAGLRWR